MRFTAALLLLAAFVAAVIAIALAPLSRPAPPPDRQVKLAVLVVFDQLRGDYLERWRPLFGRDGFVRLERDGAWFTNCYYPYATTTTGPGHASMLTGACAESHGIINNAWMENGESVYCAAREPYRFVSSRSKAGSRSSGTPEFLLSETVGDVLKETTGGRAKVFGLSLKDRSAILTTGQRPDAAYWFEGGVFGTSTYYTEKIHDTGRVHPWVAEFNKSKVADRWFGQEWTRFREDLDYLKWSGPDDVAGEGSGDGQGITFPHSTTGGQSKPGSPYYRALANSPFGNDLLLDFAQACVTAEGLGTRDIPDLLVISFSSNDLIGHTWGPDSQEVLDVTLRSDAVMARLLAFLDAQVGEGRYLLAVTADHGVCPLPEVTNAREKKEAEKEGRPFIPHAARVNTKTLQDKINAHLSGSGVQSRWVEGFDFPWIYLNPRVVKASGKSREEVAKKVAQFLEAHKEQEHVARAFTRAELSGSVSPSDEMAVRAKRSFYPSRSGDVFVLLQPYCIPYGKTGTTHGSPYSYDRHVPLLVYGPGIRGGTRSEATTPQALASIFAKWLHIRRPKDAAFPLPESLQ